MREVKSLNETMKDRSSMRMVLAIDQGRWRLLDKWRSIDFMM